MKVTDINKIKSDTKSSVIVSGKHSDPTPNRSFHRQVTALQQEQHLEYIKKLKSKIFEQGEVIKKKADISELQKYRKMISELLNETVSNSFQCVKSDSYSARSGHKIFIVIRKVNDKLDELTKEILVNQTDNLKLLGMVDDIRGLLVDLFL